MSRDNNPSFFQSLRFRYGLGLVFFLGVAGYFLWEEHKVHILENSVLLIIFGACIGMHFFMHGGHGHNHARDDGTGSGRDTRNGDENSAASRVQDKGDEK